MYVAVDGDTIVVGTPAESSNATGINGDDSDNSANSAGAAYVFSRTGTTWAQQAYLKASNTEAGDTFGRSVAISGDTVIIGADGEDSNATGVGGSQGDNSEGLSGAAYVFTRSGTTWTQQAYLKASNTQSADQFGWSVGVSGDTAIVSAPYESSNATGVDGNQADNSLGASGAAYIFTRSGTTWSQEAYLKAFNTGQLDFFGQSVDIDGDSVVVGAKDEDSDSTGVDNDGGGGANNSGAAYIFKRSMGTWAQDAYLKASNTGGTDRFGTSVGISGDIVVVGAPGEDSNATGIDGNGLDNSASSSGAAYVFTTIPPPVFTKAFGPDTITVGEISTLTFTVDNTASGTTATALDFTDNLPAGMTVANPANVTNNLGGTVTAVPGASAITLTGGTVPDGFANTLSVDVIGQAPGNLVNVSGDLTSSAGNSGPATATLVVETAEVAVANVAIAAVNTVILNKIKKLKKALRRAKKGKKSKKAKKLKIKLKKLKRRL